MTQQKTVLNWIALLGIVLLLVGSLTWMAPTDTDYPTAAEIAALVDIPEVEIPEITIPESDNEKMEELWDKVYSVEIEYLEEEAIDEVETEIDEEDVLEFLEDEGYNIDKITDLEIDDDETEAEIVNLGLEDEEDREAIVTLELKVKYKQDTGSTTTQRETVIATGKFYIDDEEKEVDLTYSI